MGDLLENNEESYIEVEFCPHCGAEQPKAQAEPQEQVYAAQYGASEGSQVLRPFVSEVEDKYRSVFKDPLYLVICILYSLSTVLAIFSGTSSTTVNVNGTTYTVSSGVSLVGAVLPILFTIALFVCIS